MIRFYTDKSWKVGDESSIRINCVRLAVIKLQFYLWLRDFDGNRKLGFEIKYMSGDCCWPVLLYISTSKIDSCLFSWIKRKIKVLIHIREIMSLRRSLREHDEFVMRFFEDPMTEYCGCASDFAEDFSRKRSRLERRLINLGG